MKLLSQILPNEVNVKRIIGSTHIAVEKLCLDSREVIAMSCFFAIKGTQVDGHVFIERVIQLGASVIVCETLSNELESTYPNTVFIEVESASLALAEMASLFYNEPSKNLKIVAVTGTNGKTTTATLLHNLFTSYGVKCGLLSTIQNKIGQKALPSTHTTPHAIAINELMAQMVAEGCEFCFMEASSHAIHQDRVAFIDINVAIFSNITHDHLDYHGTFAEYIKAKKKLFDLLPKTAYALTNIDDPNGMVMVQNTKAQVKTYGLKRDADFKAKIIENQFQGLTLNINNQELYTRLVGSFNAYNILAIYSAAILLGEDPLKILTAISALTSVDGRFQHIKTNNNIHGIVDYAHTPDALKNVLATIKNIRTNNEQVITVVGCGGNRDKTKRPLMANVACKYSDKVILTSDNPRDEDPEAILADMQEGVEPVDFKKTLSIVNRAEAIKTAVAFAQPNDIILIAGKGHEKYQEIKGVKHPFDDLKLLTELFEKLH